MLCTPRTVGIGTGARWVLTFLFQTLRSFQCPRTGMDSRMKIGMGIRWMKLRNTEWAKDRTGNGEDSKLYVFHSNFPQTGQ